MAVGIVGIGVPARLAAGRYGKARPGEETPPSAQHAARAATAPSALDGTELDRARLERHDHPDPPDANADADPPDPRPGAVLDIEA